jgi:hypothetical protein
MGAMLGRWVAAAVRHRRRGRSWLGGDEGGAVRSASQPCSVRT